MNGSFLGEVTVVSLRSEPCEEMKEGLSSVLTFLFHRCHGV